MRIYIAGPMRGIEFYNFPAFDATKKFLEGNGHTVVSPADIDRSLGHNPLESEDQDWNEFPDCLTLKNTILRDVVAILDCDAVWLLQGWENSKGATAERAIADWAGKEILGIGV